MSILWETDPTTADNLRLVLGDGMRAVDSGPVALRQLSDDRRESLLVVGADIDLTAALSVAEQLRLERPEVGVVLMRRRLDVTVLAQALRAGVREVVSSDDLATLTDACQRSRELSQRLGSLSDATPSHQGRVVTVFAAKGGVGKTTMSTNLAAELASSESKVLLVDLDLAFGDVAITLGLLPERSSADLVGMSGHLDEHGLASVVTRHDSGLDALCAPASPADAERIPGSTVTELIRTARRMYDFVVIDTPPAFTEHVLAAFDGSDLSILIATLDIPAVKNLRLTLDTLDLLGHPRESEIIVLNRSDAKVGLTAGDVATALSRPIAVQIPSSSAVPAATNRGVPIVIDAPKHPVSTALKALVRDHVRAALTEHDAEPAVDRPTRRSGAGIGARRFLRRSEA